MYCDRCGSSLTPSSQFCSSCGKHVIGAGNLSSSAVYDPSEYRVRRHIQRLATLWIIQGALRLLLILWIAVGGRMFFPPFFEHGRFGMFFFPSFAWGPVLAVLSVFCVLHFVLAWGLYERRLWARYLGLVLGFLALVRFPFGTALGIYTIWVLLPESSGREYQRLAHAA